MEAYGSFFSALTDYRRAQRDRWYFRRSEAFTGASALEKRQAEEAMYRQRVALHAAMARVRLTARPGADDPVIAAAQSAFARVDDMLDAADEDDLEQRGGLAREEANEFLTVAAAANA